jgi:hypothetical protein
LKFIQLLRIFIFRNLNFLTHQLETEHFDFYFNHQDKSIQSLADTVEYNINRITVHLGYNPYKKVKVFIYSDLKSFHYYACGMKDLPSWVVGMGYKDGIRMVTPNHEGIAVYEANQISVNSKEYLKKKIEKGNIPTLKQLNCDSITFGNIKGYDWSFTIINYIVENYGYRKLAELIKQPDNFKEIFGYSQIEFQEKWINSINSNI